MRFCTLFIIIYVFNIGFISCKKSETLSEANFLVATIATDKQSEGDLKSEKTLIELQEDTKKNKQPKIKLKNDADLAQEALLRESIVVFGRIISKRSWSIQLRFQDETRALFKPLRKEDNSARFEIAYYRIAKLLGVKTIPTSTMRSFYPDRILAVMTTSTQEEKENFEKVLDLDNQGRVWGATIRWVENIKPVEISESTAEKKLKELFESKNDIELAEAFSNMIVLDYVLGNWDRFSGGNLFTLKDKSELRLIDHNGSFYNLSENQADKLERYIRACKCVSSALIKRLEKLTEEIINEALYCPFYSGTLLYSWEVERIITRINKLVTNLGKKDDLGHMPNTCFE